MYVTVITTRDDTSEFLVISMLQSHCVIMLMQSQCMDVHNYIHLIESLILQFLERCGFLRGVVGTIVSRFGENTGMYSVYCMHTVHVVSTRMYSTISIGTQRYWKNTSLSVAGEATDKPNTVPSFQPSFSPSLSLSYSLPSLSLSLTLSPSLLLPLPPLPLPLPPLPLSLPPLPLPLPPLPLSLPPTTLMTNFGTLLLSDKSITASDCEHPLQSTGKIYRERVGSLGRDGHRQPWQVCLHKCTEEYTPHTLNMVLTTAVPTNVPLRMRCHISLA